MGHIRHTTLILGRDQQTTIHRACEPVKSREGLSDATSVGIREPFVSVRGNWGTTYFQAGQFQQKQTQGEFPEQLYKELAKNNQNYLKNWIPTRSPQRNEQTSSNSSQNMFKSKKQATVQRDSCAARPSPTRVACHAALFPPLPRRRSVPRARERGPCGRRGWSGSNVSFRKSRT